MNKKVLAFLVISGVAAASYFVWRSMKDKNTTPRNDGGGGDGVDTPPTQNNGCPPGEVRCMFSPKCYNPRIDYFADPCA